MILGFGLRLLGVDASRYPSGSRQSAGAAVIGRLALGVSRDDFCGHPDGQTNGQNICKYVPWSGESQRLLRLVTGAARRYQENHPWITFAYRVKFSQLWSLLGEAYSKCQHLAGTPLQPGLARDLARVYMIKGAVATTAIEGNTLTEDEARSLLEGQSTLPPSQQYLEQEIRNVIEGLERIDRTSMSGEPFVLDVGWIKEQNRLVLEDLEVEDHVVPGEFTEKSLVVGTYRAAPPEDVPYLMEQLVEWLNRDYLADLDDPSIPDHWRFYRSFFAAVLAHLYIAWIHPFGDGNGRTARLLECAILAHSGCVPWVSSNLMSDHYNRTRSRYYSKLAAASRDLDVDGFIAYAVEGYVDMLREQIREVNKMQRTVAWVNYVHEKLRSDPPGTTRERRRDLVLAMPEDRDITRREIRVLTTELAQKFAGADDKMVTRDLNRLVTLELIQRTAPGKYRSNIQVMDAFMPICVTKSEQPSAV